MKIGHFAMPEQSTTSGKSILSVKPRKSGGSKVVIRTNRLHGEIKVDKGCEGAGVLVTADGATVGSWALSDHEPPSPANNPCEHLGNYNGEVECSECKGKVMAKVFDCALHRLCTIDKRSPDVPMTCTSCTDYNPA